MFDLAPKRNSFSRLWPVQDQRPFPVDLLQAPQQELP